MSTATELLRRAYEALDRFAIYDDLRDEIEAYLATEKEVEPVALKHRLLQIHDALESHLGDSDSWTSEDMTDEEIREEDPIFWAAKEIASLIGDAPWDQYLHPTPKATQDENPAAFISKNGFRFNADIEPTEHGIEVPLYLHPRADIVDELVEALEEGMEFNEAYWKLINFSPSDTGLIKELTDKARAALKALEEKDDEYR